MNVIQLPDLSQAGGSSPAAFFEKEKVAIFLDYHNIDATFRGHGKILNPIQLKEYLKSARTLNASFVYVGMNPLDIKGSERLLGILCDCGFVVRTKRAKIRDNGGLRCDFDVALALDAIDIAREMKPDIIVLASGDGDFIPLIKRLKSMGIRVEVASMRESLSREVKDTADGFIDLDEFIQQE